MTRCVDCTQQIRKLLRPCGHAVWCGQCADRVSRCGPISCPVCGVGVREMLDVY
eukprot:gene12194-13761_t